MNSGKKLAIAATLGLSFMLAGCGEDTYEFINADMDSLSEVKAHMFEKYNTVNGFLYNVETEEVSYISYDSYDGHKTDEPRYFVKSYSADADLSLQFEAHASDLLDDMREKAKHVVDQDGQYMTKFLFFKLSRNASDLNKDAVSVEMTDPFGKIKCYANGSDPIEVVLQEEDDENDIERKVEYNLKGNCVPDLSTESKPVPVAAPANTPNS